MTSYHGELLAFQAGSSLVFVDGRCLDVEPKRRIRNLTQVDVFFLLPTMNEDKVPIYYNEMVKKNTAVPDRTRNISEWIRDNSRMLADDDR